MDAKEFLKMERDKEKKGDFSLDFLTVEENESRSADIKRMQEAKLMRDADRKEFDGMDYLTWRETNQQADMNYIPPKLNKQDVRTVMGTIREKDNSLLSSLLNYNFEITVTAYDKDDSEMQELGSIMQDMVRKSRELEDYDAKRPLIYRELITQGDVYVLEEWKERWRIERKVPFSWENGTKVEDFKVKSELKSAGAKAEATLLPGNKVYWGNIKEPNKVEQPYVFTVEIVPYEISRAMFSKWQRWVNVPKQIRKEDTGSETEYMDWTLLPQSDGQVEKIWYFSKPENRAQLYLNGVPMLPKDFPLTEISTSGEIPIIDGYCEQIPFFAYGKGIPAKTKVEAAVLDEMMRLAILKAQQSYAPPMANNTGRELSASIFVPGTTHDDIDIEKLKPIVEGGVTNSDMAFLDYMKKVLDSKSVNAVFMGETASDRQTATEIMEMKKQQLMKLGLIVWGVVQFEKRLNWMRIHTIVSQWTQKIDSNVDQVTKKLTDKFRRVSVDTTLEDGSKGKRIYEFNPEKAQNMSPDQIRIEEELMSLRENRPVRKSYIDPELLREMKLSWNVQVVPTEKDTSDLHRIMLIQNIRDAATIFGPQSLNLDYIQKRFANAIKEDAARFFLKPEQVQQMMAQQTGQPVPGQQPQGVPSVGGQIGEQVAKTVARPALKKLAETQ